jgi:hypothetical protein
MGKDLPNRNFQSEDYQRYRQKVRRCLDALARMLSENHFSFPRQQMGLEIELNIVDERREPAMANSVVLEKINDPAFTTELGQQNIEINVAPRPLAGDEALELEQELCESLALADDKAGDAGASLAMIGMLPTLRGEHLERHWMSGNPRYAMLNEEILAARGENLEIVLDGVALPGRSPERLKRHLDSIVAESACTSVQLHLQVHPDHFASHWNAAQALAGVQVSLAGNSPFLLGKALWHETRIPMFQQATDTRAEELRNQGVRPRVWFGEKWITSIFDLFEENARYFPALLPEMSDEDPLEALDAGSAPHLSELRLHNGTVWRWNRPVYDIVEGVPHLRVENRVLPSGPTVLDMLANAAFFYGAQRALTETERPIWTQMSFHAAEENFVTGAKRGLDTQLYWPGVGWIPPDELVLRILLPLAHEGLRQCGVSDTARERYLDVIEQRCVTRRTGSVWQRETVAELESSGLSRHAALRAMLRTYLELSCSNEPVHTWPIG